MEWKSSAIFIWIYSMRFWWKPSPQPSPGLPGEGAEGVRCYNGLMVEQASKCACPRCFCPVQAGKGVVRDGKVYCSETCAYECTEQTCLCVHDRCDEKH